MSLCMHIYTSGKEISQGYDVSEIVHDIEYTTSILGQAGKLTFTLEKDPNPNSEFQFNVGSLVKFWHGEKNNLKEVFKGFVFSVGTDRTEAYRVVAYDQTRYLQNHNDISIPDYENDLIYYFDTICNYEKITEKRIANWKKFIIERAKIRKENFVDTSSYDILLYCMNNYAINNVMKFPSKNYKLIIPKGSFSFGEFQPKFYIRDNFGTVELREIFTDFLYNDDGTEKQDFLIIGDESLLTDYNFEIDIDKDTYNEFYLKFNKNKTSSNQSTPTNEQVDEKQDFIALQAGTVIKNTGTILDGQIIGEDTIPKWGKLRKIVTLKGTMKDPDANMYVNSLIKHYNQPTKSLKLSALGYDGIYAGSSFIFSLKKLKINYPLYVISATHYYNGDSHKMDLEVNTNPTMEIFE